MPRSTLIKISIMIALALTMATLFLSIKTLQAVNAKHCSQFGTRLQAQKAYDSNPEKYSWADRDHDGLACEGLPVNIGDK